jgi:hypothetical protein
VVPMVATTALFFVADLRLEERTQRSRRGGAAPAQAVAGASAAASGSGTPAIS